MKQKTLSSQALVFYIDQMQHACSGMPLGNGHIIQDCPGREGWQEFFHIAYEQGSWHPMLYDPKVNLEEAEVSL